MHRYSDQLGFEPASMIDDLYDDRIAAIDGTLLVAGTAALVAWELLALPQVVVVVGGLVTFAVLALFANVLLVLRRPSPQPLDRIAFGSLGPRRSPGIVEEPPAESRDASKGMHSHAHAGSVQRPSSSDSAGKNSPYS